MKRKRGGREFGRESGRPKKKSKLDNSSNNDEERLQRNRSYLESIKNMISQYQTTNIPRNQDERDEDEDDDREEIDEESLVLETVKHDILQKRKLTEKSLHNEIENSVISTSFLRGHLNAPTDISINSNNRVVTVSKDNCMLIWDLEKSTKRVIKNISTNRKGLLCVSQSYDGSMIVCGGIDGNIYSIDPRQKRNAIVLNGHNGPVTDVWLRPEPDSFDLYSASHDRTVKLWEARQEVLFQTLYGHVDLVQSVDGLTSQVHVVSGSTDTTVRLWNIEKQKQFVFEGGHVMPVDRVRMLHSDCFLSGGEDGSLCFWSTQKSHPIQTFKNAHGGDWVSALQTVPYSNLAITGSCDGHVNIFQADASSKTKAKESNLKIIKQVNGIRGWVNGISIDQSSIPRFVVVCVGGEHRLGRWKVLRKVKTGIHVIRLDQTNDDEDEDEDDDES